MMINKTIFQGPCLILLLSLFQLSCTGFSVNITDIEKQNYIDRHKGKSIYTLLSEFKNKYENECIPVPDNECRSVLGNITDKNFQLTYGIGSTRFFQFDKEPYLSKTWTYVLNQKGHNQFILGDHDTILEMYGYLLAIYRLQSELEKPILTVPSTQTALASGKTNSVGPSYSLDTIDYGRFHALLIANSNYSLLNNLQTPRTDAIELETILRQKYGFQTTTLLDATRTQVITALHMYRKNLTTNDNLLIFYAGHGWLDKEADEGYWLPIDADPENPTDWIANSAITSMIKAIKANHIAVFSDSCYSGKLTRGIEVKSSSNSKKDAFYSKKARVVISSGGLEPVIDSGGSDGHSIFAAALLNTLKSNTSIIDATAVFSSLRSNVTWNADQVPELGVIHKAGHNGGDFLFVPASSKNQPPPQVQPLPKEKEPKKWKKANIWG